MIVLSNCLTDRADEGCRKVVASLVRRIKKAAPETLVISCGSDSALCDRHIPVNKLMLSFRLAKLLRRQKEPVLYLPAPAKMRATATRLYVLSRYAKWGLQVLLPMEFPVDSLSAKWIRASGAQIIALSAQAWENYGKALGSDRVTYLKTGVDTARFVPADEEKKQQLRQKYGIPQEKTVVLHVGHMKPGRNVGVFLSLDEEFHGIVVASTQTANEMDRELKKQLQSKENLTVIDTYLPNIEEVYQLADVYLFPVVQQGSCIDAPLSALEAAACGIPVAATPYGELKQLLDSDGFYKISSLQSQQLNSLLRKLCKQKTDPRAAVLSYDWNLAVERLLSR